MPGPPAVHHLQMPHPRDWHGGQMPRSCRGGLGAGGIDWCITSSLPDKNSSFVHRRFVKLGVVYLVVIAPCQTIWCNWPLLMKNVEKRNNTALFSKLWPPESNVFVTWLAGLEAGRGRDRETIEISLRLWNSGRNKMADRNALLLLSIVRCVFVWRSPFKWKFLR